MVATRARVLIFGRVQGVFFRAVTQQEAEKQGLKGWVRNVTTGEVEAIFQGPKDHVDAMIQWCHQGPPAAQVTKVQVEWETPNPTEQDFLILYE
jgi:acylphosphatase